MTDIEIFEVTTKSPLEATSMGDTSFSEPVSQFKKVYNNNGKQYYQYLVVRREDLQLLCSTLRATFGSEALDPVIKWREWT